MIKKMRINSIKNIKTFFPLFLLLIFLVLMPRMTQSVYYVRVLLGMFYLVVLSASLRLVVKTGQLSIAHYAFMGTGAYTSALLLTKLGWNFWMALPAGGLMAALLAIVLGYVTLRIKGAYFAIATFALGEVIRMAWVEWEVPFGGSSGIKSIPSPDPLGGIVFGSISSFYYLGLSLMICALIVLYRLEKSRYGLTFSAIASADDLAETVGINIMNYKVLAFSIASFFAGLVGAYYASLQHYISPNDFTAGQSLMLIVFVVVGGVGSFWGPLVGVFILEGLPVVLKNIPNYDPKVEPIIYGGFLIAVMLFLPEGLVGIPTRIRAMLERRRSAAQ